MSSTIYHRCRSQIRIYCLRDFTPRSRSTRLLARHFIRRAISQRWEDIEAHIGPATGYDWVIW